MMRSPFIFYFNEQWKAHLHHLPDMEKYLISRFIEHLRVRDKRQIFHITQVRDGLTHDSFSTLASPPASSRGSAVGRAKSVKEEQSQQ